MTLTHSAVVTGIGAVSPFGQGVDALWNELLKGKTAFRTIPYFDASRYRNDQAGVVPLPAEDAAECRANTYLRVAAIEAARQAGLRRDASHEGTHPLEEAGHRLSDALTPEHASAQEDGIVPPPVAPERTGLVAGTNFGGAQEALAQQKRLREGDAPDLAPSVMVSALSALRTAFPAVGPSAVLSLACASGAAAIGVGLDWIRSGRADVVLAGGYDELSEHAYAGLSNLRAVTKDRVLPFHAKRSGTLFAEGAGVLVLEAEPHARLRGAVPLARVLGWSADNDAFHMTAPDKTGGGIARVMQAALRDAEIAPDAVAHINCHATGTPYNDRIETTAIQSVFGSRAEEIVLTGNKSAFGHTMGAAGAIEAIVTVKSIQEGVVPPTANLDEVDPELTLDYCPLTSRKLPISVAITNSFGLGGANACVVLGSAT